MNDSPFDQNLRDAFSVPTTPASLDAKIDRALDQRQRVRAIRRKVTFTVFFTASACFALVSLPAAQAQASLGGISRAFDRTTKARITTIRVDEKGQRWPGDTIVIAGGNTSITDIRGVRTHIDYEAKSYAFDPTLNAYIVFPRKDRGSLRLSDMLGPAGGFSLTKRTAIERVRVDGRELLRVTITNNGLPERYKIEADAETELPLRIVAESQERGRWRVRQEQTLDYGTSVSVAPPDLKRTPAITKEEASARFEKTMTAKTLAQVPLKRGRLVVRAFDVAEDGTVFVAYQSGDRSPRSWSGYALNLRDDRGTEYVRGTEVFPDQENIQSPDGKIEMETFVPRFPVAPNVRRRFTVTTQRLADLRLDRNLWSETVYPDGRKESRLGSNFGMPGEKPAVEAVLFRPTHAATCAASPAWAGRIDHMGYSNPIWADLAKARARSIDAMRNQRWNEAETHLNEQLRLMRESEAKGYSSWAMDGPLKDLDKVRAAMRP